MNKLQKFSKQELLDELKRREEENKPPPQKQNPDFSMFEYTFNVELQSLINEDINSSEFEKNILDEVIDILYVNSEQFWQWYRKQEYDVKE